MISFEGFEKAINDFHELLMSWWKGKKYSIMLKDELVHTNCSQTTQSIVICSLDIHTKQIQFYSLQNILFHFPWVVPLLTINHNIVLLELNFFTENLKDFEIFSAWIWFLCVHNIDITHQDLHLLKWAMYVTIFFPVNWNTEV